MVRDCLIIRLSPRIHEDRIRLATANKQRDARDRNAKNLHGQKSTRILSRLQIVSLFSLINCLRSARVSTRRYVRTSREMGTQSPFDRKPVPRDTILPLPTLPAFAPLARSSRFARNRYIEATSISSTRRIRNSHGRDGEGGRGGGEGLGRDSFEEREEGKDGRSLLRGGCLRVQPLSSLGRFTTSQRKHDTWPLTGHLATVH